MTTTTERELFIWEKNHIEVCKNLNLFENKDVLEVGGMIPESITKSLKVKSWTCIDKWSGVDTQSKNYKILNADITTIDLSDKTYDLIFSTNSFEHINNLPAGLKNMCNLLKSGGHLSALFGPIWSSTKGNHIYHNDEKGNLYTFNDNIIPPWSHLLYSEQEMKDYLINKFSETLTKSMVDFIYNIDIINRLFADDYYDMIHNLGLEILEYRDWHTPIIPDKETHKLLKSKYGDKNFSTVSLKILLKK